MNEYNAKYKAMAEKQKQMEKDWRSRSPSSPVVVDADGFDNIQIDAPKHPKPERNLDFRATLNTRVDTTFKKKKSVPAPKGSIDQGWALRAKAQDAISRLALTSEPKHVKKSKSQTVALKQYIDQNASYFASNKAGPEYDSKIKKSLARYSSYRVPMLFAIVMGSGHGKSTLSRRYGVLDIDDMVTESEHEKLIDERMRIIERDGEWMLHNESWFAAVRKTMSLINVTSKTVILVHTEEAALSIGAQIIGGLNLTEKALYDNVRHREPFEQLEAKGNLMRNQMFHSHYTPLNCASRQELERNFLILMNVNGLPVAAPYKYRTKYTNPHYSKACPEWILAGRTEQGEGIHQVVEYYERGMVPKECVDYYVREFQTTSAYGFGVTMNDWGKVMAKISSAVKEPKDFDTSNLADANEIFPFGSVRERNRANMTIRRMMKVFRVWSHPDCVEIARHHVGERNVFVTSVLLAWKGLMTELPFAKFVKSLLKVNYGMWTSVMKDVHNLIRTSNFIFNEPVNEDQRQRLLYLDLLIGRTDYDLTVDMALEGRTGASPDPLHLAYDESRRAWTKTQYRKWFGEALDSAYSGMKEKPRKVNVDSFLDFYKYRRSWLTKGSLVVNNINKEQRDYVTYVMDELHDGIEEHKGMHNKASFFEMHDIIAIIDNRKHMFNVTKYMKKFEVGDKYRVLLPGSLLHYVIFSYVLYIAEKQAQVGTVRLNAPPDEEISFFDRKMSSNLHHMLYDWADFNAQHSKWEMAQVMSKLVDTIPSAPQDYAMFVQTIAEGMYNMWLMDQEGNKYELSNGLFSGWRGTTWCNSTLNYCYIHVALQCFSKLYGSNSLVYIDHGGDDVDLAMSDKNDALRFLRVMEAMQFDAKAIKQMISGKSEFFRITVTSNKAYASPTRGLASFVAGDWEGSGRATVHERVVGIMDQIGKLVRRGLDMDVARGCAIGALSHWCRVKIDEEWLDLPDEVIHGLESQGGLGVPDANGCVWKLDRDIPVLTEDGKKRIVPGYSSSEDYVHKIFEDVAKRGMQILKPEDYSKKLAEDNFTFAGSNDLANWAEVFKHQYEPMEYIKVIEPIRNQEAFEEMLTFDTSKVDFGLMKHVEQYIDMAGYLGQDGKPLSKQEIVDVIGNREVKLEAIEFGGDANYRRLVPDFWGLKITQFCKYKLNSGTWAPEVAENMFKAMCFMVKEVFGHQM